MTPHTNVCPDHDIVIDPLDECPICVSDPPTEWEDPSLEEALDGVYTGVCYAEEQDDHALAELLSEAYQLLGKHHEGDDDA